MPPKTADPRAEFNGRTDDELRDERHAATERARTIARNLDRPTREAVERTIDTTRERAQERLVSIAHRGLDAAMNAIPGAPGFRDAESTVFAYVMASDEFANTLKATLAATLPAEADLAPDRQEHARLQRRALALNAELRLRELDAHRLVEEEARAELVQTITGENE